MIPLPVSTTSRRLTSRLYARARLSNAGLYLLLLSLVTSLLFNLAHHLSSSNPGLVNGSHPFPAIVETVTRDNGVEQLNHLIMVPGHAIWTGIDPKLRLSEDQWILERVLPTESRLKQDLKVAPFALETALAFKLISAELASHDRNALLIFSGGQTKKTTTTTEAESYLRLALSADALASEAEYARATTENYALDSFQNLLFSIARFYEYTGHFPENITVIGYEFKRKRFVDLHRAAIRWPLNRFNYIGVDVEENDTKFEASQGELENGYIPYSKDLYGCHSLLASKRRRRNPHSRFHPYYTSTPELISLLTWCPDNVDGGSSAVYPGTLPWDLS
ncbi:hypothetical protein AX17_005789 [Amanita inopinata Kibby_2008]|nr:hypothetical protein AX17_005789 [Amanita inopinata Kibby_2008]